ncbi:MAG: hypothetical protein CMJ18_09190 [Phycisphaeraceae bacterium]|nr:hypothetical protein [Phycisphaeraceae bacterium]
MQRGLSRVEVVTVILAVLVILFVFVLPVSDRRRHASKHRLENASRIRGIQQSLIQFAQDNNQLYPGLGPEEVLTASGRLQLLLDRSLLTPEYLVSPLEFDKVPAEGTVTTGNFSHCLLEIGPSASGRRAEWTTTARSDAPVVFDRNVATETGAGARSIHSTSDWRGSIGFNDGHVDFKNTNVFATQFGIQINSIDDLFVDERDDGANALGAYD